MKRTDKLTKLIAIVLFLALAAYIGAYAYRALTDQTVTADAVAASVSVGGTASGIVVRDETVLTSTQPYIDVTAADGANVAVGGALAYAMSSEKGLERATRIHELELQIASVSAALNSSNSAEDLTARDERVQKAVLALTGDVARRELENLDEDVLGLSSLVIEGGEAATQEQLDALNTELSSLKNSSSSDTSVIYSNLSGTFSPTVDGYEHLRHSDLADLTPSRLLELTNSGETPAAGAFGKLVTDYTWYFAAVMSSADAANLTAGQSAELDFGKYYGDKISSTVESLSAEENGEVAVVFACETALAGTLSMRQVSASVAFDQYDGIRIPSQAVQTDADGQTKYVWVITAMQLERKDVEILYEGDGFCIAKRGTAADSLREGNTVVVSGKDLYEGKLME